LSNHGSPVAHSQTQNHFRPDQDQQNGKGA
jgi:hypothetical protein